MDSIYSLIKNDTTDENVNYFLYENINNGASILYKEIPAFSGIVRTYSCLKYLGSTPVFVNNYNMDDDSISASTDVGIAVNDNCKNKEKLLPFIKYCLSCDGSFVLIHTEKLPYLFTLLHGVVIMPLACEEVGKGKDGVTVVKLSQHAGADLGHVQNSCLDHLDGRLFGSQYAAGVDVNFHIHGRILRCKFRHFGDTVRDL